MEINDLTPWPRQRQALVHELIHEEALPTPTHHPRVHSEVHKLAAGLDKYIFPAYEPGSSEHYQMRNSQFLTPEEAAVMYDREIVVHDDGPGLVALPDRKAIKQVRDLEPEALATRAAYGGWIMEKLQKVYTTQSYFLPIRGVYRATPTFNFSKFRAESWSAWWSQLIQSLNGTANNTTKAIATTTAVAATLTTVTPASVGSIGLLVRITDSILNADNRPVTVNHFVAGGTQLDYTVGVQLDRGIAEYLIVHVNNDRGSGVVAAREDLNLTIAADGIRAGANVTAESINYREIEA